MPRRPRGELRGAIHHILNRGNNRATLFHNDGDFRAFIDAIWEARQSVPTRIYEFTIMSNHFHAIVEPNDIDTLSRFAHRLLGSHGNRYNIAQRRSGHIWEGRFKNFPVQNDEHFLTVARYILRNPIRAGLVARAADYPWSGLAFSKKLDAWPVPKPPDPAWLDHPLSAEELKSIRQCVQHQIPFGGVSWQAATAQKLGCCTTPRPRGRPPKKRDRSI